MMSNVIIENVRNELTQKNELRIGINASNFLLVSHIDESGIPLGIAPDLGRIFAQQIKAKPKFVVYDSPGKLTDAGTEGNWDIAFVGNEPQRAKNIAFSAPYLEIPVTFLVREHSTIRVMTDIDHVGNQISVMGRSAYDLFLTATIKNATIIRSRSIGESLQRFIDEGIEILAGLKPRLISDCEKVPKTRILSGQITSVKQSVGTLPINRMSAIYLHQFIEKAKADGLIHKLIEKYHVHGVSVAPSA
jgi:polar amino acid transport system substrate-binding protein